MKAVTHFLTYFLILFLTIRASGQSISGRVETAGHNPLTFVSVALLRDSSFITGSITDGSGHFRLSAPSIDSFALTIKLSLVGYRPLLKKFVYPDTASLAHLVMIEDDQTLGEVIVSSRKPLVTRKADRYIVNVENSYLANGQSGLDVLSRSPGLWVTGNGSIRITGGQAVTVMINDVVQRMSETELADYLRTMRSENISKIEIIPNPPSEYEASSTGGIVHIILKKARKDGLTGTLFGQYKQQGPDPYTSAGVSMDFKLQRLYLFGGFTLNNDQSRHTGFSTVTYPDKSSLYNNTKRFNDNTRNQFRAGMVYDLSANQSLNIQATGTRGKLLQHFYTGLDYLVPLAPVTGTANSAWTRKPSMGSATLNYTWKMDTAGSSLRVIGDYTVSDKEEFNSLVSEYNDSSRNQTTRTNTPSATHLSSIQADYTRAMARQADFRTGLKYVFTGRNNHLLTEGYNAGAWSKDSAASNEFRYTEALLMFYGSFGKTIGNTSMKAGLRGEMTWSEGHSISSGESIGKDYFGLFPSLFISHLFNEERGNSVHIDYARRVKRPGYNDLNPYRLQVHDFTVLTGNPELVPQYTHSFRAGYTFSQDYMADIYLQSTHNFIAQTARTIDSNVIEYKSKNYRRNTEYGLSLNGSLSIGKSWNIRNSVSLYHQESDLDGVDVSQNSFNLQSIHTITLRKIADMDVVAWYSSPYLQANTRQAGIFYMDLGFTRKILKGNGRLRLYASDIFNTFREKELTRYDDTRIDYYQKRATRTFSLSFSYNFKSGKAFARKKIEQNNSEEKGRLGN